MAPIHTGARAEIAGSNVSLRLLSSLGKQYTLQRALRLSELSGTNWTTLTSVLARTGTVVTLTAPANAMPAFLRIVVSAGDTDGDGINNWEDYKLELNPNNSKSNNQLDAGGQPMSIYACAVGKPSTQNLVAITATDPAADQPDPGQKAINLGQCTVPRGRFPLNGTLALGFVIWSGAFPLPFGGWLTGSGQDERDGLLPFAGRHFDGRPPAAARRRADHGRLGLRVGGR